MNLMGKINSNILYIVLGIIIIITGLAYYAHINFFVGFLIFLVGLLSYIIFIQAQKKQELEFNYKNSKAKELELINIALTLQRLFADINSDKEKFLQKLLNNSMQLSDSDAVSIFLLDEQKQKFSIYVSSAPIERSYQLEASKEFANYLKQNKFYIAKDCYKDKFSTIFCNYFANEAIDSAIIFGIYKNSNLVGLFINSAKNYKRWSLIEKISNSYFASIAEQFFAFDEKRQVEADLFKITHYDPVTNLPTLNFLINTIKTLPKDFTAILIIIRIGGLNEINNVYDKTTGDGVLAQVSKEIKMILEESKKKLDLVSLGSARLGAIIYDSDTLWLFDEFAPKIEELSKSMWTIQSNGGSCFVNIQFGVTIFPEDGDKGEILIRNAELALAKIQNSKLENFAVYEKSLDEWINDKASYDLQIRNAFANNEFKLYFQGQYDKDEKLVGTEVLLRWHNSERGVLTPVKFIDYAEENFLILEIGEWVVEQGFKFYAEHLKGLGIRLSLNISVMQIRTQNFVAKAAALMQEYAIAPNCIVFEIVESNLMDIDLINKINTLRDMGIEIALDDFGTGYSSFHYLQDFQFSELKIDKAFLKPLLKGKDALLVRSIMAMAKELGIRCVAEGVETRYQIDFLNKLDCECFQGYYFDKPMPKQDFLVKLEKLNKEHLVAEK